MFFLTIAAALLACAHGFVRPAVPMLDGRIVGGSPIDITEAPYQLALLLDYWSSGIYAQYCGGSLIRRDVILTAAHCTNGTLAPQWRYRAGSHFHNNGGTVDDIIRITQHPRFNGRLEYDVALIHLPTPLPIGSTVRVIYLPYQGQNVTDGSIATVTGWGTLIDGGTTPTQLQRVTMPIVNQQECVDAYSGFNPVTNTMICAGRLGIGGVDACQGDSGGPLAINGTLFGIASWGRGCAQPDSPGVYARVPSFRNWVVGNM